MFKFKIVAPCGPRLQSIIFCMALLLFTLVSCNVSKQTISHKVTDQKTVKKDSISSQTSKSSETIEKSITFISVPDEASIKALLECDSLGNVHLKEIIELKAGKMVKPKIKLVNNYIDLECKVDSFQVYRILKQRFDTVKAQVKTETEIVQEINAKEIIDKSTKWEIGPKLRIGGPLVMALILFGLFYYARKKKIL